MIYLVRHGETDWNKDKVMQGQTDIPLNDNGIAQAKLVGEKLKGINFDVVFCSPLIRTKQTLENLGIKCDNIKFDERLKERNYGEFEKTKKNSFDYNEFWEYATNKKYKLAESAVEFFDRVTNFIEMIKKDYNNKNILVVTHAGVTKVFKWYFDGLEDNEIGPYLPNNCDVLEYSR